MPRIAKNKINFTKTNLQNLPVPPRGKVLYFYDMSGNGLHVVVRSNGSKTFYVRRWINGKNEKHCIGAFPSLSIEQARDKASVYVGAIAMGDNPTERRRLLRGELTLGELFSEYVERHLKKSRKTAGDCQANFERWFGDWKDRKVSEISQQEIECRHGELFRKRGPYAANRGLQLIRATYNKGITWHLHSGTNPARGITLYDEYPRERVLQADEFNRFFSSLNESDPNFRDFVMLTLLTGARKSNVLAMRWCDVSIANGTWRIPAQQSKNKQSQTIILTESELEILSKRQRFVIGEYVFPGEGALGHLTSVKRSWTSFLKRAAIVDLHVHDLRRSLASWMASTGANVAVIKSTLNHKDLKTTLAVYARASKEAELDARLHAHQTMFQLGAYNPNAKIVQFRPRDKNANS
jgi:integrase